MTELKTIKYLSALLAVCFLLTGCRQHGGGSTTADSSFPTEDPPSPTLLEFQYGRLQLSDHFLKMAHNGVDFTLNFEKKIFTPEDDIVLTLYAANYTADTLCFDLTMPIVSRQQLIHASLTYGRDGEFSVPVSVEYTQESELEGGVHEVEIGNRKLIATKVTFHTSAYADIEESIFSREFADTYRMSFWLGEDESAYRAELAPIFSEIDWNDPTQLQTLQFSEQYEESVGQVRFHVSFERSLYGTDDDIRIHVRVENTGKESLKLYSESDISDPICFIRAELTYGNQLFVRNNVAGASEIVKIESEYLLKPHEVLERDITFYSSEFTNIKRSVYSQTHYDRCALRVWIMLEDQPCEIRVPIGYSEYVPYSYHDRVIPEITSVAPSLTVSETTEASRPDPEA